MITRYFTSLVATFNPLSVSRAHRIPRVVLAFLSPQDRLPSGGNVQVTTNILGSQSAAQSSLVVKFKDGKTITFKEGRSTEQSAQDTSLKDGELDLRAYGMNDVVQELDRHSRALRRKEDLSGER